jgi:hypothetical protein
VTRDARAKMQGFLGTLTLPLALRRPAGRRDQRDTSGIT